MGEDSLYLAAREVLRQIDAGGSGGKVFARDACIQRLREQVAKHQPPVELAPSPDVVVTIQRRRVKDLKVGDQVRLAPGNWATVTEVSKDRLFDGDVWTVVHTAGTVTVLGNDVVEVQVTA